MTVIDSDDMDTNTAMYAAIAYVVADLDDLLPRDDSSKGKFCRGAHFPEGIVAQDCNCHTHANATKKDKCKTGWPDEEYYVPHSGGGKVSDGHWSDKRKKTSTYQHQEP